MATGFSRILEFQHNGVLGLLHLQNALKVCVIGLKNVIGCLGVFKTLDADFELIFWNHHLQNALKVCVIGLKKAKRQYVEIQESLKIQSPFLNEALSQLK